MTFIWCFSQLLELALKDSLEEFIPQLTSCYSIYSISTNLYHLMKDQFEMYGGGIN